MAHNWTATKHRGIRYREHDTRKHGRQPDKYFNVRFCVKGVSVNEGYGWASEGMSASKAALLMAEL
ncbi:MAG: site-specific integrase, partial [Proteobacteria bacterium]|nr:site-specific integrase [Pseudomonadota bacterium]